MIDFFVFQEKMVRLSTKEHKQFLESTGEIHAPSSRL